MVPVAWRLSVAGVRNVWPFKKNQASDRAEELYQLAVVRWQGQKYADAIETIKRAIGLKPIPKWEYTASTYVMLNKYRLAVLGLQHAQVDSSEASTWFHRGQAHYTAGEYAQAISAYDHAINMNPDNSVAWLNMSAAQFLLGNTFDAIAARTWE